MNIITDKPLWFVILCLLLGAWYALILYYKDNRNEFSRNVMYILAFLRFLVVSIIAFLLLSPLLKTLIKTTEKPIIIFAQDQSESVKINRDSSFYITEYPQQLRELIKSLGDKFDTREYSFGSEVKESVDFTYNQKSTDLSSLIDDISSRYSNRNVGALIISSDGIFNKGVNPVYSAEKFPYPIYTVALGDTTPQKDLLLAKINYNRTAFLGNKFPIEIMVKAEKYAGNTALLEVKKGSSVLFTKNINITSDHYLEKINVSLDAKETGVQHYIVQLSRLDREISYHNNIQDIFIDVLQGKEKVLLITAGPHPDVAALKNGIESNSNYEVTVAQAGEFAESVKAFNLIILNQLPSSNANISPVINQSIESGIPILYIVGSNTNLSAFNNLRTGLAIQQDKPGFTESQPALANDFVLFTLNDEIRKILPDFPPLNCPFGNYKSQNGNNVLFTQRIGNLATDRPLIFFSQEPGRKCGVIAGEGIWRWRLNNYLQKNNHDAYNELITKIIQFLSVRVNKDPFQVKANHQYFENEPVIFSAELYNPSFELVNEPEVAMVITNEDKKSFPFTFSRSGNAYQLNAGLFPVGVYQYSANTKSGSRVYAAKGEFTIVPVRLETVNTTADHGLLFNLAKQHQGAMVQAKNLKQLKELLQKREDLKTITYTQKRYSEWINIPWLFAFILLLLSAEWFIRKRAGSY